MTPYNTGKVKIGLRYQPPSPRCDQHMEQVQSALLRPTQRLSDANRREFWVNLRDVLLWAASAAIIVFFILLPNPFD
jgi:hypothetical protein